MEYFEQRFRLEPMGKAGRIVAIAIAHHRLGYIHPFPDGNGRVGRLMSHAMALYAGIGAHGLWSISRGLARGLGDASQYKAMMDLADSPRRNDLDGRGNLSLEALEEFVLWFTDVMLDQLEFMTKLFEVEQLEARLATLATTELGLGEAAARVTSEVLRAGELARGDMDRVTGLAERTARNLLRDLLDTGLLSSATPKGPVALAFRSVFAETLFPRLFPTELGLT
jgi:Fic family protein